jgi:hypothetical protein
MEKFHRMAVLLKLMDRLRENGSWSGETHIQKSAYFAQEALGMPLGFKFVLHRHGPFSFDLRETLGEMRGAYLVNVVAREGYGPSMETSDSGLKHEKRFPRTVERYDKQLMHVTQWLGARGVFELERLGTALYVLHERAAASETDQIDRIKEIKPHISEDAARKALQDVKDFLQSADTKTLLAAIQSEKPLVAN